MVSTILVLGATGCTGKLVVSQLLKQGQKVNVLVRSKERMQAAIGESANLTIIESTILDMSQEEVDAQISACDVIISCLGHNLTLKGLYAKPRKLVRDTITRIHETALKNQPSGRIKLIVMGSNGVANPKGSDDIRSLSQRLMLSILRILLPPYVDNEKTADYIYFKIGENDPHLKWVVVRPDELIDAEVTQYEVYSKPQAGLFGGGQASRSNVAHFMVNLALQERIWKRWELEMPVLVNKSSNFGDK